LQAKLLGDAKRSKGLEELQAQSIAVDVRPRAARPPRTLFSAAGDADWARLGTRGRAGARVRVGLGR